jgi:hypothetical protein
VARKIAVELVDDVDGHSPAEETVGFGIDGTSYEIDLTSERAAELRASLHQWARYARRAAASRTKHPGAHNDKAGRQRLAAIRQWARAHGHDIGNRGRIPRALIDSYTAAHSRE